PRISCPAVAWPSWIIRAIRSHSTGNGERDLPNRARLSVQPTKHVREVIGIPNVLAVGINQYIVGPGEAAISTSDHQIAMTASRKIAPGDNNRWRGLTGGPRPRLKRDIRRGAGPSNRPQVIRHRLDVLLLIKSLGCRRIFGGACCPRHATDDLQPAFACSGR